MSAYFSYSGVEACLPKDDLRCLSAIWIFKIVQPIIVAIGTVGNILNILVLSRKAFRSKPILILLPLAVSDLTFLWAATADVRGWNISQTDGQVGEVFTKTARMLSVFARGSSNLVISLFTIVRMVSTFFPHNASVLVSAKRMMKILAVLYCLCSLYTGFMVFGYQHFNPYRPHGSSMHTATNVTDPPRNITDQTRNFTDQTRNFTDQSRNLLDQNGKFKDQTGNFTDQTGNFTDQIRNLTDQTGNLTDQTGNLTDQTGNFADQTGNFTDRTGNLTDKTRNCTDQIGYFTDQTRNFTDQIGNFADQTGKLIDQIGNFTDQTWNFTDQTGNFTDQTGNLTDRTGNLTDKTRNCTDQIGYFTDQTRTFTDQIGNFADQTGNFTDQIGNFTGQTVNFTDQIGNFTDQTGNITDQTWNFTDQTGNFTDQTGNFTDQIGNFTDQTGNFTDQTGNFADQTENFTDQSWNSTDQTENCTDQTGNSTDQNGNFTDQNGNFTDENRIFTDQTGKFTNQTRDFVVCYVSSTDFGEYCSLVRMIYIVLFMFTPLAASFLGNLILVIRLKCCRKKVGSAAQDSQTSILFAITGWLFVTSVINGVGAIVGETMRSEEQMSSTILLIVTFVYHIQLSNFAVNFFLYLWKGTLFKNEFKQMCQEIRAFLMAQSENCLRCFKK